MLITTTLDIKNLPDWTLELLRDEVAAELLRRNPPEPKWPALSDDEKRMVQFDMMIPAIKSYRGRVLVDGQMPGLRVSKDLCDVHRAECVRLGTFVPRGQR